MGPHPLDDVVGTRRPAGIGITVGEFRRLHLPVPSDDELRGYSTNPRNKYGKWYEDHIERRLQQVCPGLDLSFETKKNLGRSQLFLSNKVVDVVVRDAAGVELGLELKFLKGQGSLVDPKSMVDAVDFTQRKIPCLYCIDGPGWLEPKSRPAAEYLFHWWEFTCSGALESTLRRFFNIS